MLTYPDYRYQLQCISFSVQLADLVCHSDELVGRSNKSAAMSSKETSPERVAQTVQDRSYYGSGVESVRPSVSDYIPPRTVLPVFNSLVFGLFAVEEACHY